MTAEAYGSRTWRAPRPANDGPAAAMTDKPHDILKAYKSQHFLGSADARPLRILAEYMELASGKRSTI